MVGELRLLTADKQLLLPLQTHLRFLFTSADVLHSWALPSLGIKVDCIPGQLNQCFTYINFPGYYFGQCSELCGVNHGFMPISIVVL